jgi:signal transduction histidine kinase
MRPRRTLRTRIALGLLLYSLLLGTAILLHGYLTNERIESVVWEALLSAELDRLIEQPGQGRVRPLPHTGTLVGYSRSLAGSGNSVPAELRDLSPGLYNSVEIGGHMVAVLVRDAGTERIFMTIEVAEIERNERSLFGWVVLSSLAGAVLLAWAIHVLSGRLLQPVSEFAAHVDGLDPDIRGHRIEVSSQTGHEVATIAAAMNRYLERIDAFMERERGFIESVSHELRTPIAIIGGAVDVLEGRADLSDPARKTVRRIRQTVDNIDQLIATLLVLAREPHRMRDRDGCHRIEGLLAQLVADHLYLAQNKALQFKIGTTEPTVVTAPAHVIQVTLANLLRNAIENSDRGTIELSIQPAGVVRIRDPGHGMTPEELGRFYTAMARSGTERAGSGLGLDLIRKICEHVGWTLELQSSSAGTLAILDMRASLRV